MICHGFHRHAGLGHCGFSKGQPASSEPSQQSSTPSPTLDDGITRNSFDAHLNVDASRGNAHAAVAGSSNGASRQSQ